MPRGNYFEQTYLPYAPNYFDKIFDLRDLEALEKEKFRIGKVIENRSISEGIFDSYKKISDYVVRSCDFLSNYKNIAFVGTTFVSCRFTRYSNFTGVKFSNCTFKECHFGLVTFENCIFINDCKFEKNSVSGEYLKFNSTSISSNKFVSSIRTNLAFLPQETTEEYQKLRLRHSILKVANEILHSTQKESDPDLYYNAFKVFIRSQCKYKVFGNFRDGNPGSLKSKARHFFLGVVPTLIEFPIIEGGGWLTAWGRSIFRPVIIMTCIIIIFALVYEGFNRCGLLHNLVKSIEISLVFGYTKHLTKLCKEEGFIFINGLIGLLWYAFVIPPLLKRVAR